MIRCSDQLTHTHIAGYICPELHTRTNREEYTIIFFLSKRKPEKKLSKHLAWKPLTGTGEGRKKD